MADFKQYTLDDFECIRKRTSDNLREVWKSKDGLHLLSRDAQGYLYPCEWFYPNRPKTEESGNFWTRMVHGAYDYSFKLEHCVEILNRVLAGTWKQGRGDLINGCSWHSKELIEAATLMDKKK